MNIFKFMAAVATIATLCLLGAQPSLAFDVTNAAASAFSLTVDSGNVPMLYGAGLLTVAFLTLMPTPAWAAPDGGDSGGPVETEVDQAPIGDPPAENERETPEPDSEAEADNGDGGGEES